MEIKALAFDLDGTLLGAGGVLTDRTAEAVRACAQKGLQIIFATGRSIESSEKFRAPLECAGPMVYFNGAIIADMPSGKILHSTLLAKDIAGICLDISRKKGIYFQAYIPGARQMPGQPLLTEKDDIQREKYYEHTKILAEICDLKTVLADPEIFGCVKCMFLAEPEVLDSLRPELDERIGRSAYVVRTTSTYLEILNLNVSKGDGLIKALKHRGVKQEETIVFGDEENDLRMFEIAGLSVAPANAKDIVKSKADIVTVANTEDGIAKFLEEIF